MLLGLIYPDLRVACAARPGDARAAQLPSCPESARSSRVRRSIPYLSGRANLHRLDAADRTADPRNARRRIGTALERVGLTAAAGKRYRNYSLGMRQRLGIAAALLQPRDLLVLDEPTNGLDPQGTREVRHLISRARHATASPCSCPRTCSARSSRCAPTSA